MKSLDLRVLSSKFALLLFAAFCFTITSCGEDDDGGGTGGGTNTGANPIASFQFEVSDSDWRVVDFMNFSQNATEFAWDFGDGLGTSTEESPSYTYGAGGTYEVSLTATDAGESSTQTRTITISDPNEAIKALTGETSKTWKLYREGVSMSLGPNADSPAEWWAGLSNDGARPCSYLQEFTFGLDGTFTFDDGGEFWAEFGVFNNVDGCSNTTTEQCFEAVPSNMVNECGDDVSAWLSGTHSFEYDPVTSRLTLNGDGVWIGIPKLGTTGESITPASQVAANVSFESFDGFDVMTIVFDYGDAYWPIRYASYSDASLEPDLVTDAIPFGEDLSDISPTELSRTFASAEASDFVLLDTIASGSAITFGVDNPDGSGTLVGQFDRVAADFQELQMQTSPEWNDLNFDNLTTISLDIYIPSTNDYSGTLTRNVVIGFGDRSQTEQWWTGLIQYEAIADDLGLGNDEWHTITFDLGSPNFSSIDGQTPFDRNDLDMVYIGMGGSGHPEPGTYYIRNFVIR